MTVRRGYSDSKLSRLLKPKVDEDLNNFLPKFLVKDIGKKDESEASGTIFEPNEAVDVGYFLEQMSFKDVRYKFFKYYYFRLTLGQNKI